MKTHRWLVVLTWIIVIKAPGSFAVAADPDLVLHYRFDQDQGNKVTDLSSYKNDGVNKFGQFLEQERGRHGVMRFDGEKAVVEATSDSLKLTGTQSRHRGHRCKCRANPAAPWR